MNKTNRILAAVLLAAAMLAATIWSGAMTLAFYQLVLPRIWWAGWASIAVFSLGGWAWAMAYLTTTGPYRRVLSIIMALICFAADTTSTVGALWLTGQTLASVPARLGDIALIVVSVGVAAMIAGGIVWLLTSPAAMEAAALQDVKDEMATAQLAELRNRAPKLAAKNAPKLAQRTLDQIISEFGLAPEDALADISNQPAPLAGLTAADLAAIAQVVNAPKPSKASEAAIARPMPANTLNGREHPNY